LNDPTPLPLSFPSHDLSPPGVDIHPHFLQDKYEFVPPPHFLCLPRTNPSTFPRRAFPFSANPHRNSFSAYAPLLFFSHYFLSDFPADLFSLLPPAQMCSIPSIFGDNYALFKNPPIPARLSPPPVTFSDQWVLHEPVYHPFPIQKGRHHFSPLSQLIEFDAGIAPASSLAPPDPFPLFSKREST